MYIDVYLDFKSYSTEICKKGMLFINKDDATDVFSIDKDLSLTESEQFLLENGAPVEPILYDINGKIISTKEIGWIELEEDEYFTASPEYYSYILLNNLGWAAIKTDSEKNPILKDNKLIIKLD